MSQSAVTLLLPAFPLNLSDTSEYFDFKNDAQRQPWQASLATIAGVETCNGRQLPDARLALLAEQACRARRDQGEPVVRADPISLKADRDSATLLPRQILDVQEDEAIELIAAINAFTQEDNLHFFKDASGAWFLQGMSAQALDTYPPTFLANRHASAFLPDGQEAAPWRRLLTEIQMLLHTHPVNQRRESRGQLPINSVWFWGGSDLPEQREQLKDVQFYADDKQARVWSNVLGVPAYSLEQFTHDLGNIDNASRWIVLDLTLFEAWLEQDTVALEKELLRVNQQWLIPLAELVRKQRIRQVDILTEDTMRGICSSQTMNVKALSSTAWYRRLAALFTRSSR